MKGAEPADPNCFEEGEISGIQHAMNLLIDNGKEYFAAECQGDPKDPKEGSEDKVDAGVLAKKLSMVNRGLVPVRSEKLVAFIDVGTKSNLHWVLMGISAAFDCDVIDYGVQQVPDSVDGEEVAIRQALDIAIEKIMGKAWLTEDGNPMEVNRLMIDTGYQQEVVLTTIAENKHRLRIYGSKGIPINVGGKWYPAKGKNVANGPGWRRTRHKKSATVWVVNYWANYWKSFGFERIITPMGGKGRLALFGDSEDLHSEFCQQMNKESRTRVEAKGEWYDFWNAQPFKANHFWDCVIGCCVAASNDGALMPSQTQVQQVKKRMTQAEARRNRRGGRRR